MNSVLQLLDKLSIDYQLIEHPSSISCEESEAYLSDDIPGIQLRHLFLRDRKKHSFFLFAYNAQRKVCLKKIGQMLGVKGLTMASIEDLKQMLNVDSGAVSLCAMINDTEHKVIPLLDEELQTATHYCGVPNVTTATLILSNQAWQQFFKAIDRSPVYIDAPARETERVAGTPRRRALTENEKQQIEQFDRILD
ncbi:YbaK/EbsC family protein [Photobacterium leiognathi]|uniref:YbaK/EbsC family protein n=1 Tax=Photobacterium leiognathi TaxID=553611 RepID=UPI0029822A82|nr:YbaK/EbsC family protein [Photobacterium leiognathi]